MMFILNYIKKGEKLTKAIEIDLVSNRFLRNYKKLQEKINGFKELINQYQDNLIERSNLLRDKDINGCMRLEMITKELKKQIDDYEDSDLFNDRIELIKYLYTSNGLTFEGEEFWDEYVDPKEINDFIDKVARMDVIEDDSKKKALITSMKNALLSALPNTGAQSTEYTT